MSILTACMWAFGGLKAGRPNVGFLATCFKRNPEPDKNASSVGRTEKNFRGETQGKLLLPAVVIVIPVLGHSLHAAPQYVPRTATAPGEKYVAD